MKNPCPRNTYAQRLTADLHRTINSWKQPKQENGCANCDAFILWNCSAIKGKTWANLRDMLRERSQTKEYIPLLYPIYMQLWEESH
jgi:hypothetical protein